MDSKRFQTFVLYPVVLWSCLITTQAQDFSCEAPPVTEGQDAEVSCIFPPGSLLPANKTGNFIITKKGSGDVLTCFHQMGSTDLLPTCIPSSTTQYNFTFDENDLTRQTLKILSTTMNDTGVYECKKTGFAPASCNLTVEERTTTTSTTSTTSTTEASTVDRKTGDSSDQVGDGENGDLSVGAIVGIIIGVIVVVIVIVIGIVRWKKSKTAKAKCKQPSQAGNQTPNAGSENGSQNANVDEKKF